MAASLFACGRSTEPAPRTDVPEPAEAPAPARVPAGTVVPLVGAPEGIVADGPSGLVAVGLRAPAGIVVVDHEGRLIRQVGLSGPPRHLDLDEGGRFVVVPAESSDELITVELASGAVRSRAKVGRQPHDATAVAGRVFVGNELADTVSVVDGDRVVATLPGPVQPGGVASNGRTIAVVGVRGRRLAAIDVASLQPAGDAPSGVGPTHVVAGPDGRFYVADTQGDRILVFSDVPPLRQEASVAAVGAPYGMAVDPGRGQLWVTLTGANRLVQFDISGSEPRMLASFATVRQPNSVAVDPSSGLVFVTGTADGELQIIRPTPA